MINRKRLLNRFIKLVKVNSISKQEKDVAVLIKKELLKYGIKSRFDRAGKAIGGNCGNLYAFLKGNVKKAPVILLNAHIDTVIVNGKIRPVIRNGIIQSDGTTILGADCKASVAAIMEAIAVLKQKKLPHGGIKLLFTVAEEIGLLGASGVGRGAVDADMGFVMDGGEVCQIINRAPAQISFEARITGKAAHAGVHPEKGINAIQVASEAISWMKIGRVDKETTSNVGLIDGGTATNIVPDSVLIKGEARSRSKAKLKKQIRGMTKALAKACRMYRASMRIKVDPVYKSFKIRESSKIIEISKNAVRGIGLKPKIVPTGGGSDANIFNEMGIPSVILGVGFHNVHTSKEYVSIEDLEKGAELILSVIKQAVANSPSPSGRGKGEGGG